MGECRVCNAPLELFLSFGRMPLADRFVEPDRVADEYLYDLAVGACPACWMVQLVDVPPPEVVFPPDYPYRSSASQRMRDHFAAIASRLRRLARHSRDPFVVEIGCNDGAMLRTLARAGVRHLGVDPAAGAASTAHEYGVDVLEAFFDEEVAARVRDERGPADVVYAANTLCHIADLHGALRAIDGLLDDEGILVFEDPYLADIVTATAFDQFYDEHVYYFSLAAVGRMLEPCALEVFDVEHLDVHGGELRCYVGRKGRRPVSEAVRRTLAAEQVSRLVDLDGLYDFSRRVDAVRRQLRELLEELHAAGRRVVGYGATAKSATVTNACGIGPELVEFVCDSTPEKQGKLTPGAHIPVRPPEAFADPYPDYALLFAWNHAAEIRRKEHDFEAGGGRWVLYIPEVAISPP
ncbi:MAG: class I SAM-dependent methyltransferase [Actinomycetota bacterium]|nr:class I SAM-dependent methyltransferase [Actinomycetota bacterium]